MRQIWIPKAGPPEVLEVREAPDPHPSAGEMRIRVEASGVNFADIMGRLGLYPDMPRLPVVPGYEVAGRVDEAGAGVDERWVGRDVFAMTRFGGYADVVCVPEAQVFQRPAAMSAEEGASIPVNYLTAWQLIVAMGGLKAGETVLVHSAGGGVGIAATQIAKHIGAKVIGTASAGKHAELRALGVDHLIDYRTEDFEVRAREITGGRGVELILDAVGGDLLKKGYRLLAPTGRLGIFGASSAATGKGAGYLGMASMLMKTPWVQFNPLSLMNANKGVFGVNLGHMWGEFGRVRRGWTSSCAYGRAGRSSRRSPGSSSSTKRQRRIISFRTARTSARCCSSLEARRDAGLAGSVWIFLAGGRFAAKGAVSTYWISLDLLGFLVRIETYQWVTRIISRQKFSPGLCPARAGRGTGAHGLGHAEGWDCSWAQHSPTSVFLQEEFSRRPTPFACLAARGAK